MRLLCWCLMFLSVLVVVIGYYLRFAVPDFPLDTKLVLSLIGALGCLIAAILILLVSRVEKLERERSERREPSA